MKRTKLLLKIVLGALLAYEGFVLFDKAPNDTISEAVWDFCDQYPYILFFAGLLGGHFFWPRKIKEKQD